MKYTLFNYPRSVVMMARFEMPKDLWSKYFFHLPQRDIFHVEVCGFGDPAMMGLPRLHHTAYKLKDLWDGAQATIHDPEEMKLCKPIDGYEDI